MEFAIDRSVQKAFAMVIAFLICWLGYKLFVAGVSGNASLKVERAKVRFQLLNAAPGLFFLLFGCVVIVYALSQKETYSWTSINSRGERTTIEKTKSWNESSGFSSYYDIGRELAKNGDFAGASLCFENALRTPPDRSELYDDLAHVYMMREKAELLDLAVLFSEMSLVIRPDEKAYLRTRSEISKRLAEVNRPDSGR